MFRNKIPKSEPQSWPQRQATDYARHLESCEVCARKIRPREGESIFALKNSVTREYRHVVARSAEEARDRVGWNGSTSYVLMAEMHRPPMTEEMKERLRAAAAERKLRKSLRANTPARSVEGDGDGDMLKKKKVKKTMKADAIRTLREREQKEPKDGPNASKRPTQTVEANVPTKFQKTVKGRTFLIEGSGESWTLDGKDVGSFAELKRAALGEERARHVSRKNFFRRACKSLG